MIETEAVTAIAGISIALLGQASALAFFLGKQSQRIDSEKELNLFKFSKNAGEHEAILRATEKHTDVLEDVQECIHKMHVGKDC